MNRLFRLQYFLVVLLLLGITQIVRADDDASQPTRAARLTYVHGTVTVTEPGKAEPVPAQVNLPLLAGVLLTTADDGQAEVEFEDGSVVRLTPNSALDLERLIADPDGVANSQLRLVHGVAFLELRATMSYQYVFKAGDDELRPSENSTVRVDFDAPPPVFSVLTGSVRIDGPEGLQADVRTGENLRPDVDDPGQYHRNQGIVEDSWNQWNSDMDDTAAQQAESSTGVRNDYAGQQGYGWSDLDANGTWYDTSSGPVWQPYAADDSGFDPYGNGAWVGYASVGYVWASAYPWGWTPYRCGNWSYFHDFGWGWSPASGCGSIGWRFQVGGRPVNIARAPESYRPIRVPSPGHGVQRPILRVGSTMVASAPRGDDHRGPRQIAGVTAKPIEPVQNGWRTTGGISVLHRDFPVDGRTRQPVTGVEVNRPVVIHSAPVQPSVPTGTVRAAAPATRPADHPVYGVQYRRGLGEPAPAVSGTPASPVGSGSTAAGAAPSREQRRRGDGTPPVQTYTPGNANAAPQHPVYIPPPSVITGSQTHPTYTPHPPAATPTHPTYAPQPQHPVYMPPPAPVQAPHPTYMPAPAAVAPQHPMYTPPPAPAAAPRASSPPSSGGDSGAGARGGGRR
jgi:hypothetical protein